MQKNVFRFSAYTSNICLDGAAGGDPPQTITLTQAELDAKIAESVAEIKKQQTEALTELQALQSKQQLTAKERADLQKRIDELKTQSLTKEERAKQDAEAAATKYETERTELTAERDQWRNRYTETSILRNISDAASQLEAFNPQQIIAILKNDTQLKETVDAEGKPTGQFEARVSFKDTKDNQPITLDLTVTEAVKRLREQEGYQNLFKGQGTGGSGSHNRGAGGSLDVSKMTPEQYRAARKSGAINL